MVNGMTVEQDLFLRQVDYLIDAKKLYIEELQRTERTFFLAIGALVAFLSTEAVSSVSSDLYPWLWIIPCFVTGYAIAKITHIKASIIDIADFEIDKIEPLFGKEFPKWESHLKRVPSLGGRAKHKWSLQHKFWYALLIANIAIAGSQFVAGPIFQGSEQTQQPIHSSDPETK